MNSKQTCPADCIRIHLDEVDSTNRWLWEYFNVEVNGDANVSGCSATKEDACMKRNYPLTFPFNLQGRLPAQELSPLTPIVVTADYQTAGRGQGSHAWEAERGRNLLFSLMVHPTWLPPKYQFLLSEVWALSIRDALYSYVDGIAIKWPNDIYWNDRKISGTLIETRLSCGVLRDVVIGTGVNVNQTAFLSGAPNPVSLCQAAGIADDIDREFLLQSILDSFYKYYNMLEMGEADKLQAIYHQSLYRQTGFYAYEDAHGRFEAEIIGVAPSGTITLRTHDGELRYYEQREIRFVL